MAFLLSATKKLPNPWHKLHPVADHCLHEKSNVLFFLYFDSLQVFHYITNYDQTQKYSICTVYGLSSDGAYVRSLGVWKVKDFISEKEHWKISVVWLVSSGQGINQNTNPGDLIMSTEPVVATPGCVLSPKPGPQPCHNIRPVIN